MDLKLDNVDGKILKLIDDGKKRSTFRISKEVNMSYSSVREHMYKLLAMGKANMRTEKMRGGINKKYMWEGVK